jgi:hypothetical protein
LRSEALATKHSGMESPWVFGATLIGRPPLGNGFIDQRKT